MTLNGKNMINASTLKNCLFFDVETATGFKDFSSLQQANPRLAKLWEKRCEYYRNAYSDLAEKSVDEIYMGKASLEPEFARVVCVSFGTLDSSSELRMISFYGDDEIHILEKSCKVFRNAYTKGMKLAGHNIKGFDVACLGKRIIYTGVEEGTVPPNLNIWDKKPWDLPFLDSAEIFSFGNWVQQKYLSLDLLACSLGVESPKNNLDGSLVSHFFWELKEYDSIKDYCELDVKTVFEVMNKVSK
jgi:hypothetical protein